MKKFVIILLLSASIEVQNNVVFSHFYTDVIDNTQQLFIEAKNNEKLMVLWKSVVKVESNNGLYLFNELENAVGVAQIRPIMIKEVNSLVGYEKYSHEQAWDSLTSFNIFKDFQQYFNPEFDLECGSRLWNGGRSGMEKESTFIYYTKILNS